MLWAYLNLGVIIIECITTSVKHSLKNTLIQPLILKVMANALAPSAVTRPGLSGSSRGPPVGALGDLRSQKDPLSTGYVPTDLLHLTQ